MADELVDVYNENYELEGQAMKSVAHKFGLWVHSIHCWIVNPKDNGYVLFQKRAKSKNLFPDYLDISAAGHYQSGEKIEDGIREITEELGIDVSFDELISLGIKHDTAKINNIINRQFCHVFLLKKDLEPKEYNIDKVEVEGLVKISIEDGLKLFTGKASEVDAIGVEYNKKKDSWDDINIKVTINSFIPRVDPYYYKIFILARNMLNNDKYLSI